jgi:hypothetical protein
MCKNIERVVVNVGHLSTFQLSESCILQFSSSFYLCQCCEYIVSLKCRLRMYWLCSVNVLDRAVSCEMSNGYYNVPWACCAERMFGAASGRKPSAAVV